MFWTSFWDNYFSPIKRLRFRRSTRSIFVVPSPPPTIPSQSILPSSVGSPFITSSSCSLLRKSLSHHYLSPSSSRYLYLLNPFRTLMHLRSSVSNSSPSVIPSRIVESYTTINEFPQIFLFLDCLPTLAGLPYGAIVLHSSIIRLGSSPLHRHFSHLASRKYSALVVSLSSFGSPHLSQV